MNALRGGGRSQFATVKEFAASLDVSPSYIYKLLRDGALPGIRIGSCWRIDMKLIPEYAAKHRALKDLEKRLSMDQEQPAPPVKKPNEEEMILLRSENERLRFIYDKQNAEIEALRRRRLA